MARPVTTAQTGVGTTPWFGLDTNVAAFHVGVNCTVSGSATFNIEVTNSPFEIAGATVNALATVTSQTTTQIVPITTPARAWRINVTSGTGTVTAEAVQSGI